MFGWRSMRGHVPFLEKPDRVPMALLGALMLVLAAAGGSNEAAQIGQIVVRLAAILLIAILSFTKRPASIRTPIVPIALLLCLSAIIVFGLIPLPPILWASLAGHAPYAEAAKAAGIVQPWRPLDLVPDRGLNSLFSLLVPAATLAAMSYLSENGRTRVLTLVMSVVALAALVGLIQLITGRGFFVLSYYDDVDGLAPGLFANRNHQALLLAIGLPVTTCWSLLVDKTDALRPARLCVGAGIFVMLLLLIPATGSRAGIGLGVAGIAGSCALLFSCRAMLSASYGKRLTASIWAVIVVAIVVVGFLAVYFGRAEGVDRIFGASTMQDKRVRVLPTILRMISDFFPTGSGFGSFERVYRQYEPFQELSNTYFNHAHDDFLEIIVEGGIFGGLLISGLFLWCTVRSFKAWRAPSKTSVQGRLGSIALFQCALASWVDYPLRTPLMMALGVVFAAWLASDFAGTRRTNTRNLATRAALPDSVSHL